MLTIFAVPKRFQGHFGVIQRNAIRSWTRLLPRPDIVLIGSDEGTAEMAAEVGATHIPDVASSPSGAPMLHDVFAKGQQAAKTPMVCFVNADIILTPAWLATVERVRSWRPQFLMVGQRWNLDVVDPLDFDDPDWSRKVVDRAGRHGQHAPSAFIDYFVFPSGLLGRVPPFVIGRPGYDNWLLWHVRDRGIPLVDATSAAHAIHQNHDYSHIKAGAGDAGGRQSYLRGEDTRRNAELAGDWTRMFSIDHATHVIRGHAIGRAIERRHLRAWLEILRRRVITVTKPVRQMLGVDARLVDRIKAKLHLRRG